MTINVSAVPNTAPPPPDVSLSPVPRSGVDRLPALLAQQAKDMVAKRIDAHLAATPPQGALRGQLELAREAADQLPGEDLSRALTHPLFAKWAVSDARAGDVTPLDVNRLLLSALVRGQALPDSGLLVPLAQGDLRGPGLRARRVGGAQEPLARIRPGQDAATLALGPDREVPSGELLHHGLRPLPDADLVLDAGDPVFRRFLARMNAVPGPGADARRDLVPVTDPGPELVEAYRTVLTTLRSCWPEEADEVLRYVRVIVPFESRLLFGWSTPLFQGAVFVRSAPHDPVFTFERLVHESAHLRLFAIQRTGKLHTDPPDKRLLSAARQDPRPVIGVYHAAFVNARLCEAFARAIDLGAAGPWSARLETLLPRFRALSQTLHAEASLTDLGEQILTGLDDRIASIFGH